MIDLSRFQLALQQVIPVRFQGKVAQVIGLSIEAEGLRLQVGEICHIYPERDGRRISAEVVGFKNDRLILMPFAEIQGVKPGSAVFASGRQFSVPAGTELLGRVVDGLCNPIDDKGELRCARRYSVRSNPPSPLARRRIDTPLQTGVRAIDGLLTCGKGQRMGIFSGSGVGKSTMMGMIARNARSDVNVIALIGERGREVQEFIERDLGEEGLRRSVIVVSTSDQPSLLRIKAAWVATTIAEYFRDQGLDVTFMMDSVTRFAMAQREIGLTVGEPPAVKGYPPSVFALLPKLMERTGTSEKGTITGFYTVLVEGDDITEPITDTVRSILDGHIHLSRELAAENHYPAIDVLTSVSRVMTNITDKEHQRLAGKLRDVVATYRSARDLINIGAYVPGSNAQIDRAIQLMPVITSFLRQGIDEGATFEDALTRLRAIFAEETDRC
ncbi:MAG: flagellar protein export ATPase FliI [Chloroflexi bacterium]|nr:flagellar protein export ATPase FliI [Chloroflexota bacterium]MDA8186940.1 flagellar protein export ATPase FliI [Dehalococcoidales bacterium]